MFTASWTGSRYNRPEGPVGAQGQLAGLHVVREAGLRVPQQADVGPGHRHQAEHAGRQLLGHLKRRSRAAEGSESAKGLTEAPC